MYAKAFSFAFLIVLFARNGGSEMAGAKWRGQNSRGGTGKPSKRFFRQALLSFIVFLHGNGFGLVLMYIIPPLRFFSNLSIYMASICERSRLRAYTISYYFYLSIFPVSRRIFAFPFAQLRRRQRFPPPLLCFIRTFFSMQLLFAS